MSSFVLFSPALPLGAEVPKGCFDILGSSHLNISFLYRHLGKDMPLDC